VIRKKKLWGAVILLGIPLLLLGGYYWWGYSREETITSGETTRRYRIHLPLSRQGKEKIPLVVILHGYGDHPRFLEWYSGFSSKADKEKFAVVYPYGTAGKADSALSWNAGFCCASALANNIDDVAFIKKVISDAMEKNNLDKTRVYIGGFSNGAMMAGLFADESPGTVAAAGMVSASVGGQSPGSPEYLKFKSLVSPVPVILFHGEKDVAVPYEGGVNKYYRIPALASFESFKASVSFWINQNQCRKEDDRKLANGVEMRTASDCRGGTEVVAISVPDRGHIWFGSLIETLIYGQIKGVSATDEMWNFFQKYPRNVDLMNLGV